ncbi:MAG: dTDP-glucose 4,6-dehydratase [Chthoniobacter sp.]|jgi:dTDP-glucose 4,6-dehydratase/UDP-glucuronate decarboxylase|nr:dTDP-glucose 4,6-dehydratase [Chthoniobacter sp.]
MDSHLLRDASEVIANLGDKVQRFDGKRILLTGGAGFLGAHFTHFLLALNDSGRLRKAAQLVLWDNFQRGRPDWLEALRDRRDLLCEQRDICQPHDPGSVDMIIHAASIASPIFYRLHPIATMDANVTGLRLLLEHCVRQPLESFLFFSTSEIYGDPDPSSIPTPESYRGNVSCTGPRACYDESKRYGETLCVNFAQVHGVPVKMVRPFNNYGPGLKITDRRVIPDLFRDVLAGRNLVLLSDGRATRTFCYISDAITGYLLALLSNAQGEPFNIGTEGPEITMRELAGKAIEASGRPLSVEFQKSDDPNYLTDNPNRRCPVIEKARRMLGYDPKVTLEEGLARTYRYYLDHPDAANA